MDAFDSKEFYGHSLSDDPKLRTTTRNYEFRYNSSAHLEKVIHRVKMDREKAKQKDVLSQGFLPDFAKLCCPFSKAHRPQVFKPTDGETQIGKSNTREKVIRIMSNKEIESMISQVMLGKSGFASKNAETLGQSTSINIKAPVAPANVEVSQNTKQSKVPICFVEVQSAPEPQWVEIKQHQTAVASSTIVDVPTETSSAEGSQYTTSCVWDEEGLEFLDELDSDKKEVKNQEGPDKKKASDLLSFDSGLTDYFVTRNDQSPQHTTAESPPDSPMSFGIESSLNESEHAEMERVLGKVLPHVPDIQIDDLDTQRESDSSVFPDGPIDGGLHQEYASSSDNPGSQVNPIIHVEHNLKPTQKPSDSIPSTARSKATKLSTPSPRMSNNSSLRRSPLDMKLKKQIELLKQEKIRIFSKMTSIQEKIIETLDRLRMSLLELSLPDCHAERKVRERNAFEFSVRFSRNYIFPLGRMIEELRQSPKDDYCSAKTNEPCVKVCGIYGILSEALQCYHKQLRHFFTDNVPKKLDVLLNMLTDTTKLCLQKKIFDKRDKLIECLLLRNSIFLDFVMKFAAERKNAKEEDSSPRSGRKDPLKLSKTSSKWDLTMNLNNLNMYEPKLVPKKIKKKPQKKTLQSGSSRTTLKSVTNKPVNSIDDDTVVLPAPDPVDTQVGIENNESSQNINSSIEEQQDQDATKNVIDVLKDITKTEVHQMLGPLVLNLDSILKNSDNPQIVESMLGFLNLQLQAKCKQLKNDAAATENNTQKVTKKGADFCERREENRQKRVSKSEAKSQCSFKEGSTERTESSNARIRRASTMCDKQSRSNIDIVAVDKNNTVVQKTRSRSNVIRAGAFLSAAATAKKPKPAPAAIRSGIPPRSPVQLDEVMLSPPPQPPTTPATIMTSQCLEYTTSPPAIVAAKDKFDSNLEGIGDGGGGGGYPKGYQKESATKERVTNGAANAVYVDKEVHGEACPKNPPPPSLSSPAKNEAARSGQMEQLNYCPNAQYTFVKYHEDESSPHKYHKSIDEFENVPEEEFFADSYTRLTGKNPQSPSYKSLIGSNSNLLATAPQQIENEKINGHDVNAVLEERSKFIDQCKEDPLYTNPQFQQPWKVLSKISQNITDEIVRNFESVLSFGEDSYVRDFIDMEMRT